MKGIDVYSKNKSDYQYSTQTNDRNNLLQRIELLEMENSDLRKREQYLKMVNSTLLQALGNKQVNKQVGQQRQEMQYYQSQPAFNYQQTKINPSNIYQKKKRYLFQERQKQSRDTIYQSRDSHETYKHQFDLENEQLFIHRQKLLSKTKPSNFYQKSHLNQLFKRNSTPKANNRFSNNNFSNSTMKSQNILIDSLQNQSYFSKRNSHLPTSIKSQKSVSKTLNKNVATALLCDICGLSYSPLQFITHAQQCQYLHQSQITNEKSFSQTQQSCQQSEQQEILYNLQQQKNSLLNQINRIKKNKNTSQKKLQKNLDQIVFIINNKKSLNQKDIKNLLKQKNTYMTPITRKK